MNRQTIQVAAALVLLSLLVILLFFVLGPLISSSGGVFLLKLVSSGDLPRQLQLGLRSFVSLRT